MGIIEKAAAKGEELRKAGWDITAVWVSEKIEAPNGPNGIFILLLGMKKDLPKEQMEKLYNQARTDEQWVVLQQVDNKLNGVYPPETILFLGRFLKDKPPVLVWEAASKRKARQSKEILSSKQ